MATAGAAAADALHCAPHRPRTARSLVLPVHVLFALCAPTHSRVAPPGPVSRSGSQERRVRVAAAERPARSPPAALARLRTAMQPAAAARGAAAAAKGAAARLAEDGRVAAAMRSFNTSSPTTKARYVSALLAITPRVHSARCAARRLRTSAADAGDCGAAARTAVAATCADVFARSVGALHASRRLLLPHQAARHGRAAGPRTGQVRVP